MPISSSMNPVGSGARALGMGGAFIGVADDATAASWNPAGLIQLETPEISVVGDYWSRQEDDTYLAFPEASGRHDISASQLNYLSLAHPFNALGTNFVASINYQNLYDFSGKKRYDFAIVDTTPPPIDILLHVNENQQGNFRALAPAIAVQINPFLSLGLTVNLWDNPFEDNKWEVRQLKNGIGYFNGKPKVIEELYLEENIVSGVKMDFADPMHSQNINFNLGLLWELNQMLTLGAVVKSPFEASMEQTRISGSIVTPNVPKTFSHQVVLDMPMSYGLGLALRLSDAFTVDIDTYRTEWGSYVFHNAANQEINPVTGKALTAGGLRATTQVRLGAEYLTIGNTLIVPVRAGIFYDPEPATDSIDDFFGFSLGTGLVYQKVVFDVAYQYRFGNGVREEIVGGADSYQDIEQHKIYLSAIYHF